MNPADYILDVTTPGADIIGYNGTLKNGDIRGYCQNYIDSDLGREMEAKINTPSQFAPLDVAKQSEELDRLSGFEQTKLLMWRNIVTLKRSSIEFEARVISTLFMGLLGGLVFFDLSESTSAIRSRMSALFYAVAAIVFSSIFQLVQVFPLERDLVIHERRGNAYSLNSYYFSRMLTDRLPLLVLPLIFSVIYYYMTNLRDGGDHFAKFLLMVYILFNTAQSLSLFVGSIVPNPSVGAVVAPLFGVIFMLFASYLVKRSEIPKSVKWITDISFMRWGMQGLANNEFDGYRFEDADPRGCGYQTGNDVLADYSYDEYDYGESVSILILIFFVFNALLYISLFLRDRVSVKNI